MLVVLLAMLTSDFIFPIVHQTCIHCIDQINCLQRNNDDLSNKHLHQGKWWSAAMMATTFQAWSCSLALPPTPAPSLICLKEGYSTASPSCLGGSWSSVGEKIVTVTPLTLASLGLQATTYGLPSTL